MKIIAQSQNFIGKSSILHWNKNASKNHLISSFISLCFSALFLSLSLLLFPPPPIPSLPLGTYLKCRSSTYTSNHRSTFYNTRTTQTKLEWTAKSGSWNTIKISLVKGRNPTTRATAYCDPGCAPATCWNRKSKRLKSNHWDMWRGCPNQYLKHFAKDLCQMSSFIVFLWIA